MLDWLTWEARSRCTDQFSFHPYIFIETSTRPVLKMQNEQETHPPLCVLIASWVVNPHKQLPQIKTMPEPETNS